jgi:dipeptidyl aminopeptidase/acylaminoacyl peptidase
LIPISTHSSAYSSTEWVQLDIILNQKFRSPLTVYSKNGSKSASLLIFTEGKDKKQYIRVFDCQSHMELKFIDVTGMKKHGLVFANGQFGALQFSDDESKLLYIAEKEWKPSEYFNSDLEWNDAEKMEKANLVCWLLKAASLSF